MYISSPLEKTKTADCAIAWRSLIYCLGDQPL